MLSVLVSGYRGDAAGADWHFTVWANRPGWDERETTMAIGRSASIRKRISITMKEFRCPAKAVKVPFRLGEDSGRGRLMRKRKIPLLYRNRSGPDAGTPAGDGKNGENGSNSVRKPE